jgi:hypothetical protein
MAEAEADPAAEALVDDVFWLRRAGDLVVGGATLRADAAKQLMTALAWLWTVYTGAAVLSTIKAAKTGLPEALLLAAPSVMIVIAYAAAVYAYLPLTVAFDPQDPQDVRAAYTAAVNRGWRRMQVALALAGLAAVSLAAAITAVTVTR